jgi:hypothetical protein
MATVPLSYHPEIILVVSPDCTTLLFVKDYRKSHEVFQYVVACDRVDTTTRRGRIILRDSRVLCPARRAAICHVVRLLVARDIILRIPTRQAELELHVVEVEGALDTPCKNDCEETEFAIVLVFINLSNSLFLFVLRRLQCLYSIVTCAVIKSIRSVLHSFLYLFF